MHPSSLSVSTAEVSGHSYAIFRLLYVFTLFSKRIERRRYATPLFTILKSDWLRCVDKSWLMKLVGWILSNAVT